MSTILTPKVGENRVSEMTSPDTSFDTKCWAARWYAEMIVDLFLSNEAKLRIDNFEKLSLGDKVKEISTTFSKELIDALYLIENLGNKGSHFKINSTVSEKDAETAVNTAIGLFDLILFDLFKNGGLAKTPNTARLFSTFLPSIRSNVLSMLIDFSSFDKESEFDVALLQKYLLALTKNNQREKARRLIKRLYKKSVINDFQYEFWEKTINQISGNLSELPVPKSIEDCKRNFDDVLSSMDEADKEYNSRLIDIFNILLDKVEPSEMGDLVGDVVFAV